MYELDDEEKGILAALEKGQLKQDPDEAEEISIAHNAARHFMRKDSRINIRLSTSDLNLIKRQAVMEGLPYQTYISSLLHKLATGQINRHPGNS